MRLTTKGRYAVTAMLDLAIHRELGPISLADISQRQGISLSYGGDAAAWCVVNDTTSRSSRKPAVPRPGFWSQ